MLEYMQYSLCKLRCKKCTELWYWMWSCE